MQNKFSRLKLKCKDILSKTRMRKALERKRRLHSVEHASEDVRYTI
jgi:hypothetical protein